MTQQSMGTSVVDFFRGFSSTTDQTTPIYLSIVLTCLLAFVVPVATILIRGILSPPLPLLILIGLAGAGYALFVWYRNELICGTAVGVIVLSTFGANFPFSNLGTGFEGTVISNVVLVQIPLVVLASFVFIIGSKKTLLSNPVLTFGAFTFWSGLAAVFGAGPNTLVALYFALFMIFGLLALISFQWLIVSDRLPFRAVVTTLAVIVCGHIGVALVQLVRQQTFGLTQLGEGANIAVSVAQIPLLGEVVFGTFVSGFTGMSFNLANLIVLGFPSVIALAYRSVRSQWYLALLVPVSYSVLRATSTDAGRGGLLLALVVFGALSGWAYREEIRSLARTKQLTGHTGKYLRKISVVVVGLPLLFYPSSASGSSSTIRVGGTSDSAGGSQGGGEGVATGGQSTGTGPELASQFVERLTTTSVPFFDLANLGIRLQQYIVGLAIFTRHPLFGLGGMNFVLVAETYGITADASEALPPPIHNIYITVLAETGLVGFVLYFGTLSLVLIYGLRLLRESATDRLLVAGVMAGLVGSLGFGFWDILQLYHSTGFFPLWILAGALVGEYRRVNHSPRASSTT